MRLGYYQKATAAYEQLLATYERGYPIEPHQKQEVIERLGHLYTQLQRYADAVRIYEELVQTSDNKTHSLFRLGITNGLDGDFPRAIDLLEQVRKQRPDAVVVYSKLGWAHALNGNDRLAMSFYNQALALDSQDLFSLFRLGQYFHMMGDRRRSAGYFKRVLEADRDGSYTAQVRELTGDGI